MSSHIIEDLTSSILDFQANIVRVTYTKKTTLVEPHVESAHARALEEIWAASKLEVEETADGQEIKWRKIGFQSENLMDEFEDVGVLGLDCLVRNTLNSI